MTTHELQSKNISRGYTKPLRTAEQVEHRFRLMQELHTSINEFKDIIKKHEAIVNQARSEIYKKQEILDFLSRGDNIPGETY